jgi:hypothetical protein
MNPQVQTGTSDARMAGTCKVGLVQINNSFSGQNYLPYAVGLIEGYVRKFSTDPARFDFLLPVYKRQRVAQTVEQMLEADVVGFSTYVWNEKLSLAVARELKARKPGILIVFGGPQVPDRTEPFLRENPFVDVAVNGEGEHAFTKLLDAWPSRDWSGISNLSYIRDGEFVCQAKGPRIRDLNDVPSPYLEGIFAPLMAANPTAAVRSSARSATGVRPRRPRSSSSTWRASIARSHGSRSGKSSSSSAAMRISASSRATSSLPNRSPVPRRSAAIRAPSPCRTPRTRPIARI